LIVLLLGVTIFSDMKAIWQSCLILWLFICCWLNNISFRRSTVLIILSVQIVSRWTSQNISHSIQQKSISFFNFSTSFLYYLFFFGSYQRIWHGNWRIIINSRRGSLNFFLMHFLIFLNPFLMKNCVEFWKGSIHI
jgi:hypothetical protein